MSTKHKRVIGATTEAVNNAEAALGFPLPPSFRTWLLENNGRHADDVWIFPVFDERDARTTWDSIVRQFDHGQWGSDGFEDEEADLSHLLPFASPGTGDLYCFDYRRPCPDGEVPVVLWSHETGQTEDRGASFAEFLDRLGKGEFEDD